MANQIEFPFTTKFQSDQQNKKDKFKHPKLDLLKPGQLLLMNTPDGMEEVTVAAYISGKNKHEERGVYVDWRGSRIFVTNNKALSWPKEEQKRTMFGVELG